MQTKEHSITRLVVVVLVVSGTAAALARYSLRHMRSLPTGDTLWRIRYVVTFDTDQDGARVSIFVPGNTSHSRVFRQRLSHPGMRMEVSRPAASAINSLVATAPQPGSYRFVIDQDIHFASTGMAGSPKPGKAITTKQKEYYLRDEPRVQASNLVVRKQLAELIAARLPKARTVERIYTHCIDSIAMDAAGPNDALGTIQEGAGTTVGRARAMVALCRAAKIPARLVCGFELRQGEVNRPLIWVETRQGYGWVPFDLTNEFKGSVPKSFVPVGYDTPAPVTARNGIAGLHAEYSVQRFAASEIFPTSLRRGIASILDLTHLPLQTRRTLALVLLLPLGALITALFRNVVGIPTFGTFTPSLIAMSFVYADARIACILFALVVTMGLCGRFMVEQMKLLMVPRLSVVLTLVVLVLVFCLSALDYLGLSLGSGSMLMPLVILTMLIERIHITEAEDGFAYTLKLLVQTLAVAALCYGLLRWRTMGYLLIRYPELHLFTLAVLICAGRYSGYRLTELWRFRDFGDSSKGSQT